MLLLGNRGLFAGLIVMVVIVILLCLGLATLLVLRILTSKKTLDADFVKKELYRRETEVVIKIFKDNAQGADREMLIGDLRRIKSAEMMVEEIIKKEKAERGIVEKKPAQKNTPKDDARPVGAAGAPHPVQPRPVQGAAAQPRPAQPRPMQGAAAQPRPAQPRPMQGAAQPRPAQPPVQGGQQAQGAKAQPAKKKKDDLEFRPFED